MREESTAAPAELADLDCELFESCPTCGYPAGQAAPAAELPCWRYAHTASNAEQWLRFGFTCRTATAWAVFCRPEQAAVWRLFGFDAHTARGWAYASRRHLPRRLRRGLDWDKAFPGPDLTDKTGGPQSRDEGRGFHPAEARRWSTSGWVDPRRAWTWRRFWTDPAEALSWSGVSADPAVAHTWASEAFSADEALSWRQAGFQTVDDTRPWRGRLSPEAARQWERRIGLAPLDWLSKRTAIALLDAGVDCPAVAAAWLVPGAQPCLREFNLEAACLSLIERGSLRRNQPARWQDAVAFGRAGILPAEVNAIVASA